MTQDGRQGVSEGLGYGLLLAVGCNRHDDFDLLLASVKRRENDKGLTSWRFDDCGPVQGDPGARNAAADADLDVAFALCQADHRWPGQGYGAEADRRIRAIKEHLTTRCGNEILLLPSDASVPCPQDQNPTVDPSYFAPAYYREFARRDPENAAFWSGLVDSSYRLLDALQSRMDGVFPDWAHADGTPAGTFGYDACRVPWRIAVDYRLSNDPRAKRVLEGVNAFVDRAGGLEQAVADPNNRNSAFLGGLALARVVRSTADLEAAHQQWMAGVGNRDDAYYQGTLRVLYLLTAAGQ